jgi:hypothetical protein
VDDPAGYGQEHPQIQSAVQLTQHEIASLQAGTQQAYTSALALFVPAKKYFWNAFRGLPAGPSATNKVACTSWMRAQCTRPANESAVVYPAPSSSSIISANLSIAAFLVTRGAHSFMNADKGVVEERDSLSPFYRLFYLAVGTPLGECVESGGVFTRKWSGGLAKVDCDGHGGRGTIASLEFGSLLEPGSQSHSEVRRR